MEGKAEPSSLLIGLKPPTKICTHMYTHLQLQWWQAVLLQQPGCVCSPLLLESNDKLAQGALNVLLGRDGDVVAILVRPLQAEGACRVRASALNVTPVHSSA